MIKIYQLQLDIGRLGRRIGVYKAADFFRFREAVNSLEHVRDQTLIKLVYLAAARPSEVTTRVCPSELRKKATKPYGSFLNWSLENFEHGKDVLLIKIATTRKRENPFIRMVALPTHPRFEPWTVGLLRRIQRNKKLEFDLTRVTVNKIVKENLTPLLRRKVRAKDLRQFRIEHLVRLYDFDPYDIAAVSGLSFRGNLGFVQETIEQKDTFLESAWKRYLPKLLKPITDLR